MPGRQSGKRGGGAAATALPQTPRRARVLHPRRQRGCRGVARSPHVARHPALHPLPTSTQSPAPGRDPGERLRPGLARRPTRRRRERRASFPVVGGLPGAPRAAAGPVKGPSARLPGSRAVEGADAVRREAAARGEGTPGAPAGEARAAGPPREGGGGGLRGSPSESHLEPGEPELRRRRRQPPLQSSESS